MSKLYIFLVKKKTLYFKNTSTLYQHFTSKTWTEQKVKFFKKNILLSKQQPIVAKTLLMKDTCYNRLFMKIKKVSPVFSCPKKEHFRLQKFSEKKKSPSTFKSCTETTKITEAIHTTKQFLSDKELNMLMASLKRICFSIAMVELTSKAKLRYLRKKIQFGKSKCSAEGKTAFFKRKTRHNFHQH